MSREQENNMGTAEKGMEQAGPSGAQAKFNDILEKAKAEGKARAEQGDIDKAEANALLNEYYLLKRSAQEMSGPVQNEEGVEQIQARMNEIRQDSSVSEVIKKREADPQTEWEKKRYVRYDRGGEAAPKQVMPVEQPSVSEKEKILEAVREKGQQTVNAILENAKAEGQVRTEQGDEKAAENGLLAEYRALKKSSEGMSESDAEQIQARMNEIRQDSSVSEVIKKREAAAGPAQTEWEKKRYPRVGF